MNQREIEVRNLAYIGLAVVLALTSCVSAPASPAIIVTADETFMPLPTSTTMPAPTERTSSTGTPTIPAVAFTPLEAVPVSAHPLSLTEHNAGTEMKRLNIIGTGTAHDIKFSPDGKRFAVATGRGVYLYDGSTFEQNGFIDVNDSVSAIAFSPDGNVLAVAVDGKASLWNVSSGQQMMNFDGALVSISKLAYGRGGYVAAIGGTCRGCGSPQLAMILWNAQTGRQIFMQRDIWYLTQALEFTPDGRQLFFGGQNGVTVIESETGEEVEVENWMKTRAPYNMIFNADGSNLFISSFEDTNLALNMNTEARSTLSFCDGELAGVGNYGVCFKKQQVVAFDLLTGEEIKNIDTNIDAPSYSNILLAISPDGRFLVYGEGDIVRVVSVKDDVIIRNLDFPEFDDVETGLMFVNGFERYLVAMRYPAGQITLIDLQTNENVIVIKMECCEITGFAFAPDRRTVAILGDHILQILNVDSRQVIYESKFQSDFSGPIAFSPDGTKIYLSHSFENYILEFDLITKSLEKVGENFYAYSYADPFATDNFHFNSRGNLVVLEYEKSADGQNPSFRDLTTDQTIVLSYNAIGDPQFVESFALNHDDTYLVFGNTEGIFVWDTTSNRQLLYLDKHERRGGDGWMGAIKSLMFSPKSDLLVSIGWDQTTRLWNIKSGIELRTLNVCCSASFTPDGRYLVTAGDGVIRVWGIPEP